MQKAVAKAKGKEKTARTPKNDEMSIASKLNNMQPSPAAATKGSKDKLRPPRHPSGKKSIGVKPAPTHSLLEVENVVEDRASHENSQSALQDTFRLKGKKARSKDCEEAVNAALTEFWDSAWNICAERFFINTAPITVSFELRNAWLRMAEAEWQDLDMRETPNTRPNRIFKRDEPPLPLAFDTWSRGAVEILPRFRHDSVMDPFLRDLFDPIQVDQSEILEEMDEEEEDEDEEEMSHEVDEGEADEGGAGDHLVVLKAPAVPDDNWQLDLDDEYRLLKTEKTASPPKIESPPKLSGESEMVLAVEPPVMFLLSPRSISMEESVTDVESASPSRAPTTYSSRKSQVRRKFSPGQCGGQVGSGVFRFPTETTSEAIRRMQENIRDHHRQSHVQIIDEDRVAYKQKRSVRSDDDMVVQPLFEEQTPRSATGHDNANRFHELSWRGVSYTAGQSNRGPSIDNVTADMDRKFLQRKLVNLHSRFKKQSIKYFGKTAKTVEDAADTVSLMDSIQRSSTNSSFTSKNSKKGGVFDKRKFTRGAGVNTKYASRSLLALGGNVVRTQSHVKATSSKAKGTTSDPGLPKRNKDTMVASLLERRLKAENSEPRDNNKQKGGDRAFGGGGARDFTASGGGGGGGGGGGFSTAGDRYKIGGGGGGGGIQFSNGLRGTSRMEILDPELMRNKRLRYCKNCPTATNTSSS